MRKVYLVIEVFGAFIMFAGCLIGISGSLIDLSTLFGGNLLKTVFGMHDEFAFFMIVFGLFLILIANYFLRYLVRPTLIDTIKSMVGKSQKSS